MVEKEVSFVFHLLISTSPLSNGGINPFRFSLPSNFALLMWRSFILCYLSLGPVGSQGDGAVQFVAKSKKHASTLVDVLKVKLGTTPFMVCIGEPAISGEPSDDRAAKRVKRDPAVVKTAVIPAAGFGTRLFPASRSIRPKALFPVIDTDGFAKPLILYLVEQCIKAGIEDVIIVVGPGEQVQRVKEIFMPVPPALYKALKPHMREYADRIAKLQHRVRIAIQHEPKGFGDAVACAPVEPNCPFALLLGDVAFRSEDAERSCLKQALRAFQKEPTKSVISVTQVPLAQAGSYGVVNTAKASLKPGMTSEIERIVEKPDPSAAEQLASEGKCNIVLGPYILTAAVMTQLTADVESDRRTGGEIQLTSALESILEKEGMNALLIDGNAMDTGNPLEYSRTISAMTSDAKAP